MARPAPPIAVEFLRRAEACRLMSYRDGAGVWTIGFGHASPEVTEGLAITAEQADADLAADIALACERLAKRVDAEVIAALSDHQYASLISFVFNLGADPGWTIWRVLNDRHFDQVPGQIIRFDKVRRPNGQVQTLAGLTHRRAAEVTLWRTPDVEAAVTVATASATPPPPSSQTRSADTPPTPPAVAPLAANRSFAASVAAAVAAAPLAINQAKSGALAVSDVISPYADKAEILQHAVGVLAVACAVLAVAAVALQWLNHHRARRA